MPYDAPAYALRCWFATAELDTLVGPTSGEVTWSTVTDDEKPVPTCNGGDACEMDVERLPVDAGDEEAAYWGLV